MNVSGGIQLGAGGLLRSISTAATRVRLGPAQRPGRVNLNGARLDAALGTARSLPRAHATFRLCATIWPNAVRRHGALDSTFGSGGTAFGVSDTKQLRDAVIQPDGKIVTAGEIQLTSGNQAFAFGSLQHRRQLGCHFRQRRKGGTDTASYHDGFWGVALQADGKIIAAGQTLNGSGSDHDSALARYLGDPPRPWLPPLRRISRPETMAASDVQPLLDEALAIWEAAARISDLGEIQAQILDLGGVDSRHGLGEHHAPR